MEVNISQYNYDAIKYFISVATHGSLLRASFSLGISQSALSQSMKNLEQSLNVKLFHRNTRGIVLTNEGETLYEYAKMGNQYFKEGIIRTLRMKNNIAIDTFKISASQSILRQYVFPFMRQIIEKYPMLNFEFSPYLQETKISSKIQNGEVDLVISKTNAKFLVKEMATQIVAVNEYSFCYHPNYFQLNKSTTIEELKQYPILIKERDGSNDNSWMQTSFERLILCRHDDNIVDLVNNGIGIGLCARLEAEREGFEILEVKNYKPMKRTIEAFYLETNEIAKDIVEMLIDLLEN